MILPDVNILLYAVNSASDRHMAALGALRQGFGDPRSVAFAWTALSASCA
jgi:predicted nucleic acid-binding protein